MLQDVQKDKIDCIVVKDLSRLQRDYTVGHYLEMFFPSNNVRFVSINDQFDTTNGITTRDKSAYIQSRTHKAVVDGSWKIVVEWNTDQKELEQLIQI